MTNHNLELSSSELCKIIAKIFLISEKEIEKHIHLFNKSDPLIRNCLYYLSKIENDSDKITAALSLEFLVNFKKSPFE